MPSVGSSSRMIFGSAASARAIASCCCCPPDRTPPGAVEVFHQIGKQLRHQFRNLALAVGAGEGAHQDILADREIRDDLAALRHVADAGAGAAEGRILADVSSVEADLALRIRSVRPMIVLNSVVLPTPLRPSTAMIFPDRYVQAHRVQNVAAIIELSTLVSSSIS